MKTLCLVRHAKASQQLLQLQDIDRPLIERGYNDAHFLSKKLSADGHKPGAIITSIGIRALTTALIFARNMQFPPSKIQMVEKLYNANVEDILETIHQLPDDINHVMIFGHNPSITNCTNMLVNDFFEHIPTCGIACFDFNIDHWHEVKPRSAVLRFFDFPKKN